MPLKLFKRALFSLILMTSLSLAANASQSASSLDLAPTGQFEATLSLGYGGITNPINGADDIHIPVLPSLAYYGESFYFDDFTLGYTLLENERVYVDVAATFNQDGFFFEFDGADRLFIISQVRGSTRPNFPPTGPTYEPIALNPIKRNLSYMAGLVSGVNLDYANIELSVLNDVTSVHNGHEAMLTLWKNFVSHKHQLLAELGVTYKNSELINYYYDLRPGEAIGPIGEYDLGGSALNWHLELNYAYEVNIDWSITARARHTFIDHTLSQSPMFEEDSFTSGFVGITYHF